MKPLVPLIIVLFVLGLACEQAPERRRPETLRDPPPGAPTNEFVFRYSRSLDTDSGRQVYFYNPVTNTTVRTRYVDGSVAARDLFLFRAESIDGVMTYRTYKVPLDSAP
jgi:hypothetical protein